MNKKKVIAFSIFTLMFLALTVFVSATERPKEEITPLTNAEGLDLVIQMNPVTFKWTNERTYTFGFLTEEAKLVHPLFVSLWLGDQETFNYKYYTVVLTKAVQEQQTQIDAMETSLCNLGETRWC